MRAKPLPSQAELLSIFRYDGESGNLFWLIKPRRNVECGDKAGHRNIRGYVIVKYKGEAYKAHRIIWKMLHNEEPEIIDHRNNTSNTNKLVNLRPATKSQNGFNSRISKHCKVGLKGVSRNRDKYVAHIRTPGKQHYLGTFDTAEEAHEAYMQAAMCYHKEFANDGISCL